MKPYTMTRRSVLSGQESTSDVEIASIQIGNFDVLVLSDGHFNLPGNWFVNGEVKHRQQAGDPIKVGANVWLIRSKERVILVDTGAGPIFSRTRPTAGKLDDLLAAEKLDKAEVTDIVITHMHADHIGGLMGPDAGGYSNAKIHLAKAEWDFWADPDLTSKVSESMKPLVRLAQSVTSSIANRIIKYENEAEIVAGVHLIFLPGHTPGHSGVLIADEGQELLIVGDAIIAETLQFQSPDISYILDIDPEMAIKTRTKLLANLAQSGRLMAATHLTYPGIGRVTQDGDAFEFHSLA